jgi:hypothetical protein
MKEDNGPCSDSGRLCSGYKVVRVMGKQLWSSTMSTNGARRYVTDKVTYPKSNCGPLCVFQVRSSAYLFAELMSLTTGCTFRVYRCTYTPSSETKVWTNGRPRVKPSSMPNGTVLASSVTITYRSISYVGQNDRIN